MALLHYSVLAVRRFQRSGIVKMGQNLVFRLNLNAEILAMTEFIYTKMPHNCIDSDG